MTEIEIKRKYNENLKRFHNGIAWFMAPERTLGEQLSQEDNFSAICKALGELAHMLGNNLTEEEWFNGFKGV